MRHPFRSALFALVAAVASAAIFTLTVLLPPAVGVALVAGAFFFPDLLGADPGVLLADGAAVAFSSQALREAKRRLVGQSREKLEAAKAKERKAEETPDLSEDGREKLRAEAQRLKSDARAIQEQAKDLDEDIELAQAQENAEAELGRSQGTRAGRQDAGRLPGSELEGGASDDLFDGEPLAMMPHGEERQIEANRRGLVVGRYMRALAAGKGDVDKAIAHAAKHWGEDDLAYRALATTEEDAGGALTPDPLAETVIELLRPMSVIRSLNPTVIPMGRGTLRIAKLAGGAAAEYIGENDDAPETGQQFGTLRLDFKKLAALVPVGNDLIRYATPNVDGLVRDDTSSALAERSDLAFIRGQGTEHAPKGLRYWAPAGAVVEANSTVNIDNVTEDLGKLVLALEEANSRMLRPGWVFAPRTRHYLMTARNSNGNYVWRDEMLQGTLWGWPFRVTTQVPKNLGAGGDESEVYLADFADVVIGEALNLLLDASTEAAYVENGQVKSAFSRDQTAIRALQEHDFGMRHDESVAVLTGVTWGA